MIILALKLLLTLMCIGWLLTFFTECHQIAAKSTAAIGWAMWACWATMLIGVIAILNFLWL